MVEHLVANEKAVGSNPTTRSNSQGSKMMSERRLLAREEFKRAVFARDRGACVICGAPAVDAHHIIDRKLFSDGGYYLGNGASLCSHCHLQAEMTTISVETIRAVCAIATPVLPEGLDPTQDYDKCGNALIAGGLRRPGPMFQDDGARKILARAGLLYTIFALP